MPTLSRARRKPITPLEKSAAPPAEVEAQQQAAEPPDLDTKEGRPLLRARELAYAVCMSLRLEKWLLQYIAAHGIPLDNCLVAVTLLPIYVEACLKAFILYPQYLPHEQVDEADEELVADPRAARAAGLQPVASRPGKRKPVPTLPGCPGVYLPCGELRRYGERLCPGCGKVMRRLVRQQG
jgi:hypothetical protein